jgi:TatA/E family protein of Tat protein translocase
MGSIGGPELLLILVLAFLLFGPRRLPEIGRSLGKMMGEFRRATMEFRTGVEREIEFEKFKETRTTLEEAGREMRAGLTVAPDPPAPLGASPESPGGPDDGAERPGG